MNAPRRSSPDESARIDAIITRERASGATLEVICAALAREGLPLGRTAVHERARRLGVKPRGGRAWRSTAGNPAPKSDGAQASPKAPTGQGYLVDLASLQTEDAAYDALWAIRDRGRPLGPVVAALGHALAMLSGAVFAGEMEGDK